MASQQQKVKDFFDRSARRYRKSDAVATQQYFEKRLELALKDGPTTTTPILDIGCGTGLLYDALKAKGIAGQYYGIDLSEEMLNHSNIPLEQRQSCSLQKFVQRSKRQFDYLYALGLTTYLTTEETTLFYQQIRQLLQPNGKVIISYTHQASLDFKLRNWIQKLIGRWLPADRSMGRNFPIFATTPSAVQQQIQLTGFSISRLYWLPASIPLLAWPLKGNSWSGFWRADFIVELTQESKVNALENTP